MVFTGLVSGLGNGGYETVKEGECWRLSIKCEGFFKGVILGDSIAVNGCCLTAVELSDDTAAFDVMSETLRLTCLEDKTQFNLEKAMSHGDRMGGHVVQGHVHGIGKLLEKSEAKDNSINFWFEVPDVPVGCCLKHKGSICIDGVSLTVAEVRDNGKQVRVSIIPHTQKVTTFGILKENDRVNIEFETQGSAPPRAYTDEDFMLLAIAEGEKGRATAPPNPWVGCVVVRNGVVVGRGYHVQAGTPHAEINAMKDAGGDVAGCTVYTTLEPCAHHGRTPPCCAALVAARIARCVVAVLDPDEKVSGRGVQHLRDNGVEVVIDCCHDAAATSLRPYLHQRRTGLPYVVLKIATTLDGYVACSDSTSQWITGKPARAGGQQIRAESQAIIVGSGTALADNPRLTVRTEGVESERQPLRVVLDRRGRVTDPSLHLLSSTSKAKTLLFTVDGKQEDSETVEVKRGDFTLESVLKELASRGILQVMVEGGGAVHTSFVESNLCDHLVVFQGSTVLGDGKKWLQRPLCDTISKARFFKLEGVQQVGNDVRMDYEMKCSVEPPQ